MNLPRLFSFFVTCLVLLALATCGKDSPTRPTQPTPQPPAPAVPTRITITPAAAILTSIGQTIQLIAAVYDNNNAQISGAAVTWSSNQPAVASVDSQGLVTAVKSGTAVITARSGSASQNATITVVQSPGSITIEPATATLMAIGETVQLSATVLDQNRQPVDDAVVAWHSDKENVATVDPQGLVTAVGNGTATITARAGEVTDAITVNVSIEITEPLTDREVLISLYNKTNGPNWTTSTNWLSDEPLETWYGVNTNSDGEVTHLNLGENNLEGSIPPELGQLQKLRYLDLISNRLSGSIPRELGQLAYLTVLGLTRNNLSGSIPRELGQLGSLNTLTLADNRLTGNIPAEIGQLGKLNWLALNGNQLSGAIPPELGQLSNLGSLWLSHNNLTGTIPVEIGHLSNLKHLGLDGNFGLSGPLPDGIANTQNMEVLFLNDTQICIPPTVAFQSWFESIPNKRGGYTCTESQRDALVALYDLTDGPNWTNRSNWLSFSPLNEWFGVSTDGRGNVTAIDLVANNLNGPLPGILSELVNLEILNLSMNPGLAGTVPHSYTNLNLVDLSLDGTQTCAPPDSEFQAWLGRIPSTAVTDCTDTRRDFYILSVLYNSTNGPMWADNTNWLSSEPLNTWYGVTTNVHGEVTELTLNGNKLQGIIPPDIGLLEKLSLISLRSNQLTGNIPSTIGQLEHLTELDVVGNKITGPIPPELGNLGNLTVLELGDNQLTGSIPVELAKLEKLTILELAANGLTGPIPPELGRLDRLRHLHIALNNLSGTIPPELGNLTKLRFLDLFGNRLEGTIPHEIGQLGELVSIEANSNLLTGSIPPEIGQLGKLERLGLLNNRLTGEIPPEIGRLRNLKRLFLRTNHLTGSIPKEIGNLKKLELLHLDRNKLTGPLPAELGGLENLEYMYLSYNQLSGAIPPEIGQLEMLQLLFIDNNRLTGVIPQEIGNLKELKQLVLSVNNLTGNVPHTLGELSKLAALGLTQNKAMSGVLPQALTRLSLDDLLLDGTGLCAPQDHGFLEWLQSIRNSRVSACESRSGGAYAYLVQSTQSREFPVPLVAGEDALLRVFVALETDAGATMPPVRATFYLNDAEVHSVDMTGLETAIPREIDEGDLSASANFRVPGTIVTPGLEMVIEIDPDRTMDSVSNVPDRLPPTGRIRQDVREIPPLQLTMVPFLWEENPDRTVVSRTENLSSDDNLFRYTHDLLPIKELDVSVHEPVWISVDPVFENLSELIRLTTMIRITEGASGHYMGIVNNGGGWGELGGKVSVALLDEFTIAHELGHNMNLLHAPCGGAGDPDVDYPYQDGAIGVWGYDAFENTLVRPETPDLMSYCHPQWISDYHFSKAMGYRLSQAPSLASAFTSSAPSLLLWGGVNAYGELVLEPAFVVDAIPFTSGLDGPYQIEGEDADGRSLFSLSFGMAEIGDGAGGSFAFALPLGANWSGRLDRITLIGPEGVVTRDGRDDPEAVMLMDRVTGSVRGLLKDWPRSEGSAQTARRILPEPGLDVIMNWSNQGSDD